MHRLRIFRELARMIMLCLMDRPPLTSAEFPHCPIYPADIPPQVGGGTCRLSVHCIEDKHCPIRQWLLAPPLDVLLAVFEIAARSQPMLSFFSCNRSICLL